MHIIKKINNQLYPLSEFIFERKYIPCLCRAKPSLFEIFFSEERWKNIKLEVNDFDINRIGHYSPIGVGGPWWIYSDALITLRRHESIPDRLEFVDLAFFELYAGWFWAIKDGKFTEDYHGKYEEEQLNETVYPLQD